jgi:hypothetical protein
MRTTAVAPIPTSGQAPGRLDEHLSERARREFRCVGCGYGAVAAAPPLRCPMCGGASWMGAEGSRATDSERQP